MICIFTEGKGDVIKSRLPFIYFFLLYSLKLHTATVCSFCNVAQQLHELQIRLDFHQNKRDTTPIFFSCFALKIMQSRNEIDIWTLKCMSTVHTAQWGYANYQDNDDKPLRYRICSVYHIYAVPIDEINNIWSNAKYRQMEIGLFLVHLPVFLENSYLELLVKRK